MRSTVSDSILPPFAQRYFPRITAARWCDWHWQLAHRYTTGDALATVLRLSRAERAAFTRGARVAITPYQMSLLDPDNPRQALRRALVPTAAEFLTAPEERNDPLFEERDSPVPGLVHRYPNRVLLLATDFCATRCRYCMRSRRVDAEHGKDTCHTWDAAIHYIATHRAVNDVLISGGDPLTLPDAALRDLLTRLRAIPHVAIIRIGTKVPVALPQRITPALTRMLAQFHPLYMNLHIIHPDELTPAATRACAMLANAGIPLGSQTPLLRGINDTIPTMRRLMMMLLAHRIKPYYLFQCDLIAGSRHFRTPVQRGLDILRAVQGHLSGLAVPHFAIDALPGAGKILLVPNAIDHVDADGTLHMHNYAGHACYYPDRPS